MLLKYIYSIMVFLCLSTIAINAQITKESMPKVREVAARYIKENVPKRFAGDKKVKESLNKLNDDGIFSDLKFDSVNLNHQNFKNQHKISVILRDAFFRLSDISWSCNKGVINGDEIKEKIYKSVIYYGNIELKRKQSRARWPFSPFLYPYCASVIYFSFYNDMETVKCGKSSSELVKNAAETLKKISFQAFTEPERKDVKEIYSIERFRNSTYWVGGNFGYRYPFLNAALCNDVKMLNLIWDVCNKAISHVSFNTEAEAFWNEGLTSDGSAWGHGRQSYAFGYGLDGIKGVLRSLRLFSEVGTDQTRLNEKQFERLYDFAVGLTWLQFRERGCLSVVGRHNFLYKRSNYIKRIENYLASLLSINPPTDIKNKLMDLQILLKKNGQNLPDGVKSFWNNDDLVMRGNRFYVFVNMISSRSIGPETVPSTSSAVNYNLGDGTTVILKRGDEYDYSAAGWNFAIPPGATCRDTVLPKENIWRGFSSKHNFAGGIGGKNGVAGFILEKIFDTEKSKYHFKELLGIKAYKSYFMFNGIMIALGAGIDNMTPEQKGNIITCINQTYLQGELQIENNGKQITLEKPYERTEALSMLKDPFIMRQREIGYAVFPGSGTLKIAGKSENAKWDEINKRNKRTKRKKKHVNVFSISIDHGKKVKNGSYHYMVIFNRKNFKDICKIVSLNRFKVLVNSTKLQAVYNSKEKCAQLVVYDPQAKISFDKLTIKSSRPAIIRLQYINNNQWLLSVADPTQNPNLKSITITINEKNFEVEMPLKPDCGKQTDINIEL